MKICKSCISKYFVGNDRVSLEYADCDICGSYCIDCGEYALGYLVSKLEESPKHKLMASSMSEEDFASF